MLQVERLSVEVAGRTVLHEVDLRLAPGEVHVLFGPNGSGNTSLLMAIMGVPRYRVTSGRIVHDLTGLQGLGYKSTSRAPMSLRCSGATRWPLPPFQNSRPGFCGLLRQTCIPLPRHGAASLEGTPGGRPPATAEKGPGMEFVGRRQRGQMPPRHTYL